MAGTHSMKILYKYVHYLEHRCWMHVAVYSLFMFSWPRFESGSLRNGRHVMAGTHSMKILYKYVHYLEHRCWMHVAVYSLFMFSWLRFESGSLRNGRMLILRIYFAVDSMPIEMYGESWVADLLNSDDIMLYMAGFGTTRGI